MIPLGILASSGAGIVGDFVLLDTRVLSSNQATVVFSNLGQYAGSYRHLQIRYSARSTGAGTDSAFYVQFNADTSASYSNRYITGTGGVVVSGASTSSYPNGIAVSFGMTASGSAANNFGAGVLDILDAFSTSKNTTLRALAGSTDLNRIALASGAWFNTNAISSITIDDIFGNIVQNSRFSLYGVK